MNWFQYLLQVNLYLVLFYGFYALVLRNETFFRLNRIYLVSGAALSFLIPLIQSHWVQSLFITDQIRHTAETFNTIIFQPVVTTVPTATIEAGNGFSTLQIISAVYITGLIIFLGKFIWQLVRIKYALQLTQTGKAFSFFNIVSIDPLLPSRGTILQHEQAHVRQWHSADVLFFEIVSGINWFNPVVYIYKKAIRHIHEFIADEIGADQEIGRSEYALLLLSNTFGVESQELINNFFNQSLLKRRIFMLSKTKSKKIAVLKYGLSAPLFAAMLIFSAATVKEDRAATILSKISPALNSLTDGSLEPGTEASKPVNRNPSDLRHIYQHLQKINYPSLAREKNIQGDVAALFKITAAGKVDNILIAKGLGYGADEEVVRILSSYKSNEKDAEGQYMIPILFRLQDTPASARPAPFIVNSEILLSRKILNEVMIVAYGSSSAKAQTDNAFTTEQVQVLPQFPGGPQAWARFMKGYKYPPLAVQNKVSGKVFITFVIETDGSLTDIQVVRDIGFGTGEEAVRLLKTSPRWSPGVRNGRPVRVQYTQPIQLTGRILQETTPGTDIISLDEVIIGLPTGNNISAPRPQTDSIHRMESVQVLPQFPGGAREWAQFMQGYNYPALARENNVSGKVSVSYIVEKDGTLTDIKVFRDIGFGTGEEAVRLMKTSPKWQPGIRGGQPVRVAFTQQISLALN